MVLLGVCYLVPVQYLYNLHVWMDTIAAQSPQKGEADVSFRWAEWSYLTVLVLYS